MKQKITILGATGSIGTSVISVIDHNRDLFELYAITAHNNLDLLIALCVKYQPKYAVIIDDNKYKYLVDNLLIRNCSTKVLVGIKALCDVASSIEVDIVVSAIVGASGLLPSLAAAKAGKKILLANKETLVIAGELFIDVCKKNNSLILPIDSEHNAIFQVLPKNTNNKIIIDEVKSVILTASGGPFLNYDIEEFRSITPQMALKHPNWKMGKKITIDSATMMNKGFEVIEAFWLFSLSSIDQIEVVIHPQSIIHSLVRFKDGSLLAQLGSPDIRIAISYCLEYPKRLKSGVEQLDLLKYGVLNFLEVDKTKFKCLDLAYESLKLGKDSGCIINAANEIAVMNFLNGNLSFDRIYKVIRHCLESINIENYSSFEDLLTKDNYTRIVAQNFINKLLR